MTDYIIVAGIVCGLEFDGGRAVWLDEPPTCPACHTLLTEFAEATRRVPLNARLEKVVCPCGKRWPVQS